MNKSLIFRLADALYKDFVKKYGNVINWGTAIAFLRRMDDWRDLSDNSKDDLFDYAHDNGLLCG